MGSLVGGSFDLVQMATPPAPAAGVTSVYAKTDGRVYQNILGFEFPIVAQVVTVDSASTANLTLSGAQTVDGVVLTANVSTCLVKNQTNAQDNGPYVVQTGAWTRHVLADSASEVAGMTVTVRSGAVNGGARFETSFKATDTLGTTVMPWMSIPTHSVQATAPTNPQTGDLWTDPTSNPAVLTSVTQYGKWINTASQGPLTASTNTTGVLSAASYQSGTADFTLATNSVLVSVGGYYRATLRYNVTVAPATAARFYARLESVSSAGAAAASGATLLTSDTQTGASTNFPGGSVSDSFLLPAGSILKYYYWSSVALTLGPIGAFYNGFSLERFA